ncbi:MAG: hypothetical protein AAF518_03170 [Spirochaetota bacterium]
MNPIISSPGSEYVCPSCGKKSKLPMDVPKYGLFKVACFYCKYISEVKFEFQEEDNIPAVEIPPPVDSYADAEPAIQDQTDDFLHPLHEEPSKKPFPEDAAEPEFVVNDQEMVVDPPNNSSEVSQVSFEKELDDIPDYIYQQKDAESYTPPATESDFSNPIDNPMDLNMASYDDEEDKLDIAEKPEEILEPPVKDEIQDKPDEPAPKKMEEKKQENTLTKPSMALVEYRHIEFSNRLFGKIAKTLNIGKIAVQGDEYVPIFEKKTVRE